MFLTDDHFFWEDHVTAYQEATLPDVLTAREKRVEHQKQMLARHGMTLICFTLNIAGPVKVDEETRFAFFHGASRLRDALRLSGIRVAEEADHTSVAGHEIMLAVTGDPLQIKRLCTGIEETDLMGRLYDMDVLRPDGSKVSRGEIGYAERCCIVCGSAGRGCASRRIHSAEQVRQKESEIIRSAQIQLVSEKISACAVRALLIEVGVAPKPGLVDRIDSGSHRDMDIFTFFSSISVLQPTFAACYRLGAAHSGNDFPSLQSLGLEAEAAMYRATGGVNTQKGIIFMMSVLCYTAGQLGSALTADAWQEACAALYSKRTSVPAPASHGEAVYQQYGAAGVKGEAKAGFPSVFKIGVPALHKAQKLSLNDRCLYALLVLIASVEDTNMLFRCGKNAAEQARTQVRNLLASADHLLPNMEALQQLNLSFIQQNLSPGGCADLLASSVFVTDWLAEIAI